MHWTLKMKTFECLMKEAQLKFITLKYSNLQILFLEKITLKNHYIQMFYLLNLIQCSCEEISRKPVGICPDQHESSHIPMP